MTTGSSLTQRRPTGFKVTAVSPTRREEKVRSADPPSKYLCIEGLQLTQDAQ